MSALTKKMIKAGFSKFDVADYLDTPGRIAAYLDVTIEEANGDQAIILKALNNVARAQKRNMTQLAKASGMTRSGLYAALSGERDPGFGTVIRLLGAMGMTLTVTPAK
jgi:probable addiction module antidote protein